MTRQEEILKGLNESWGQNGINISSNTANSSNGITVNNPTGSGRAVELNFVDGINPTRLTAAQIALLPNPQAGQIVYQTDGVVGLYTYDGTSWVTVKGSTTVFGTTNRISVTGGDTIDIASTYVGQTSITTLGTVTTGTWGAVIGQATITLGSDATGDIYYRDSGGKLTRLGIGSAGQILGVSAGVPAWTAAPSSSYGVWGISNTSGAYTYYATLTLAMAAATAGQTIELFADVIETGAVTITLKNGVNINGNGHTYTLDTSTTTTGFIDGGVAVVMTFTNITLIRKGAGAGIMLGLSVIGNRIIGSSTFIKIESNSSTGIGTYTGVNSGYVNGFTVTCTGTSCSGINLTRGYVDNCNVISTGTAISTVIGTITNSYGESTGAGFGIYPANTGYASNCVGKGNTSYGIYAGVPVYNSTGYSAGSYGIYFASATLSNCTGMSAAAYGIFGNTETINNCTSISTASGALLIQNAQANNCVAYSTASSAVLMYDSSTINNSTLRTTSGAVTVNTTSLNTYGSLKNCTIINDWNNASGHGVAAKAVLTVINCAIKVANASANCLNASSAVTMKYANNSFEGSTIPVNVNITQGIINIQDNQGNILI